MKVGSDVIIDIVIGIETFPPVTLPHFFHFVSFLLNVFFLSHIINLSLLVSSLNILFCYGGTSFLTGTELVVANHCFEHCFSVTTITVHNKTVNFLLFSRCENALNFTISSCFLIERHGPILKIASSNVSGFELLNILVQSRISCTDPLAYLDTLRNGKPRLHHFQRLIYKHLMNFCCIFHHLRFFE